MTIHKKGQAHWEGDIKRGKGTVSTESGVLNQQPYGFNTRFEGEKGTNPEELIGAAHAACFSMALSLMLGEAGFTPDAIETTALAEDELIGSMAIITGHSASAGTPCEGKFTDKFGQTHYVLLEPDAGKEFKKGDKVLIICRLSATRYLAELNPWPTVL